MGKSPESQILPLTKQGSLKNKVGYKMEFFPSLILKKVVRSIFVLLLYREFLSL